MLRALISLFAALAASNLAPEAKQLEAAGPWRLVYADDGCVLSRTFVAGRESYEFSLTVEPVVNSVWLRLHGSDTVRSRDDGEIRVDVDGAPIRDLIHFNIFKAKPGSSVREFLFTDFPAQAGNVQHSLRFHVEKHGDFQLNAPDFAKALSSVNACRDDLDRSLGVDPTLLASLKTKPDGTSGAFVDLPDFTDHFEYKILFWVTETGKVDECHLLESSGDARFDAHACDQLKAKGKFIPARNLSGQPVRAPVYENLKLVTIVTRS